MELQSLELRFTEVVDDLDERSDRSQEEASHTEHDDDAILDQSPTEAPERLGAAALADDDVDDWREDERQCAARKSSDQGDHEVELRDDSREKD